MIFSILKLYIFSNNSHIHIQHLSSSYSGADVASLFFSGSRLTKSIKAEICSKKLSIGV